MKLLRTQVAEIAQSIGLTFAELMAFIAVESGGTAFINGRIVIQFEPRWFKKKAPFAPSGKWSINRVENQVNEYKAFSEAFGLNKKAAMEATSWGLGQIMGYHYARLGYKSVDDMVDDFKKGEYQQVQGIAKFIATSPALLKAIKAHNWHLVAVHYNGAGYKAVADEYGREPYNLAMAKEYLRYAA